MPERIYRRPSLLVHFLCTLITTKGNDFIRRIHIRTEINCRSIVREQGHLLEDNSHRSIDADNTFKEWQAIFSLSLSFSLLLG